MAFSFAFKAFLRDAARLTGIDRAIFFGILSRVWSFAAGPVTVFLIAYRFSPEVQGFHYTFGSLLGLQIFIEMGLGTVIIQFASHEWARLRFNNQGRIDGERVALSRLIHLGQFSFCWYAAGGVLVALGLGLGGFVFFSLSCHTEVAWHGPWLALCFLTGIKVAILPVWALLQGCNQVAQVHEFRVIERVLASLTIWTAIWSGAGLWSSAISTLVALIWAFIFLFQRYAPFIQTFLVRLSDKYISWKKEIFPFQWRTATTWSTGYFTHSLFTPVLFHFHGPVAAGQMGMTWTLIMAVSDISTLWVSTKFPLFGRLVSEKRYSELDRVALRSGLTSWVISISGALLLGSALIWVHHIGHPFAHRLLYPFSAALFLMGNVVMHMGMPMATYLHAHKKEPFVALSLTLAFLVGCSAVLGGKYYAAMGMGAGYLATAILIFFWTTRIFLRCREEWHRTV